MVWLFFFFLGGGDCRASDVVNRPCECGCLDCWGCEDISGSDKKD